MQALQQPIDSRVVEGITRSVLIVDDHQVFASGLSLSFQHAGFDVWASSTFDDALGIVADVRPGLVVSEVRLDSRWIFDFCESFHQLGARVAIATAYPSIATAIRAVRLGIGVYIAKPVTAALVLNAFEEEWQPQHDHSDHPSWPSLDRTIWEYINQVFIGAGSMSEAARRLRLDRRSLRRMLAKHPPAR